MVLKLWSPDSCMSPKPFQSLLEILSIGSQVQNNFYNNPNAICLVCLSGICTTGTKACGQMLAPQHWSSVAPNSTRNPGTLLLVLTSHSQFILFKCKIHLRINNNSVKSRPVSTGLFNILCDEALVPGATGHGCLRKALWLAALRQNEHLFLCITIFTWKNKWQANYGFSNLGIWQIFLKMNKVTLSLRGMQNPTVSAAGDKIWAFRQKLRFWKTYYLFPGTCQFPNSEGLFWWDRWLH